MRKSGAPASAFTAGCLFSGIGGFCTALEQQGVDVLWANENDGYAAATYRENHKRVRLLEKDVRELTVAGDKLQPVDILTAGFPCQSFSQAGDRKGFEDERGMLFMEIIRIVKEFGKSKPKILLLENVPYLMSGENGNWFDRIRLEIMRAGYWFNNRNAKVLDTSEVSNLPQRRPRLFMVAMSMDAFNCNNFLFPEATDERLSLSELINKGTRPSDDHYMVPDNRYYKVIAKKMDSGDSESVYQLRRSYARENKGVCSPLTANMGGGGHNVPFVKDRWGIRRLTVEECAKLQGFTGLTFPKNVPESERYKQIGNAVSVPVIAKLAERCKISLRHS